MIVRLLILGGAGMLGHKLSQMYRGEFETWVTLRGDYQSYERYTLFDRDRTISGVDAREFASIVRAFESVKPDVVINCIGIIKQLAEAKDPITSITGNALLPHLLKNLCQASGSRLIHISSDCVFSGHKGNYDENDISDAEDLYGRTKFLGEVSGPCCLTLRTSIIGRELRTSSGLVEWFLGQQGGSVCGYTKAIYSGFTTIALADIIKNIIVQHPSLSGLCQVSSEPITKYELLCMLRDAYKVNVDIIPDAVVSIDRSLNSGRFRNTTGFRPPAWADMVHAMAEDPTPYVTWRQQC